MDNVTTLLTNADANIFFGNCSSFLDSPVLEATLRYIAIKHHIGDIEKIQLIKTYSGEFGSDNGNAYISLAKDRNLCVFVGRRGYDLPYIDEDGWVALDTPPFPVAPFLSRASETRVYLNKNAQSVIIFVKSVTGKWIDLLCSTLGRLLPWIYTDDNTMSEEEIELFRLFVKGNDTNRFQEIINSVAKDLDFKNTSLKKVLLGWGQSSIKDQIENLKAKTESTRANIRNYETSLASEYDKLSNLLTNINALMNTSCESDDSLYQFFMTHKQLGMYKVDKRDNGGSSLWFSVTDTIEFFDAEAFKRAFNNQSSYFPQDQVVRDIFWGLFGANKGVVRVESMFKLNNLSSLECVRGTRTNLYNATHLPHPHQYYHACLGGNGTYIMNYMSEGNWDMAIEQAIASVKNINFGDYTVMREFIGDIIRHMDDCKCIVADNGTEMTPREFLTYIKANENEDTENG